MPDIDRDINRDIDLSTEITELLADLVRIESTNPSLSSGGVGEASIASWVAAWCETQGLAVDPVDSGGVRPSLVVRSRPAQSRAESAAAQSDAAQSGPRPATGTLLLCGHLDTVDLGAMTDPLVPRVDGDRLYGRGSYDMKAGLAAALIACREAARLGLDVDVVVAAVADEEHGSLGIQRVLDHLGAGFVADAAVVTEPTEMAIGVAHKGFVWTEIDVMGVAAHGSRPQLGVDAIVRTGTLLVEIEALGRRLAARAHPLLGPGTVHAGVIEGGQGPSTIPERCRLTIERRTLPGESPTDVEREVGQLLATCAAADPDFRATARTVMHRPPLETAGAHPLVAALSGACQDIRADTPDVSGLSYWADSAFIAARGIPTVLFGPGGDGAHADVEWVSLRDTADCARVLVQLARHLGTALRRNEA